MRLHASESADYCRFPPAVSTPKKGAVSRINQVYRAINIIRMRDYASLAARYYYLLDGNRVTNRDTSPTNKTSRCQ